MAQENAEHAGNCSCGWISVDQGSLRRLCIKYPKNNQEESARFENIREEADYGATGKNGYSVVDGKV
jgi:hypothetical protein